MDYITCDGDVLDQLCYRFYGKTAGVTEQVIMLNPAVSEYLDKMPEGITIHFPSLTLVEGINNEKSPVRLWD